MLCNRVIFSTHHVISVRCSIFRQNARGMYTTYVSSCVERDLSQLSTKRFWLKKYTETSSTMKPFDWFTGSDIIVDAVKAEMKDGDVTRVLDVGCGTSSLPGNLYSSVNHPLEIYCLDFIPEAVFQQQHWINKSTPKHSHTSSHFLIADVCALPWKRDCFDVIVDKGTMDSLIKDRKTRNEKCSLMMTELHRLVNQDGVVLQVSDEGPEIRLNFLEELSSTFSPKLRWTVRVIDVFGSLEYFMYVGRLK